MNSTVTAEELFAAVRNNMPPTERALGADLTAP